MMRFASLFLVWMLLFGMTVAGPTANAAAAPSSPPPLTRGINLTNWFRYPPSRDPAALATYLTDRALDGLRAAGFDFVRLAIDPDVVTGSGGTLIVAIRRIQAHGMAVIVSPHPHDWHVETDRERLLVFWREMAPKLAILDPILTLPEVLNEPVFPNDAAGWAALQHRILNEIRRTLPRATVVLTGNDWGSVGGLVALKPESDPNVLYSFHFYDPAELTSLAAYRNDVDRAALAQLPFPGDRQSNRDMSPHYATRDLAQYYCSLAWDAPRVAAGIDRAASWARQHDVRLLLGEFGASIELNAPSRLAWLKAVREASEARNIGWALWGYDDIMGFALHPRPGARPVLDPAVLSALGMPALGMPALGMPALSVPALSVPALSVPTLNVAAVK